MASAGDKKDIVIIGSPPFPSASYQRPSSNNSMGLKSDNLLFQEVALSDAHPHTS